MIDVKGAAIAPGHGPKAAGLRIALSAHAPVRRFSLDDAAVRQGVLKGYAAPEETDKSCALKLLAGGTLFGLARAWEHSVAALTDGIQDGWAGFSFHNLGMVMALGVVELRCAVSDAVLTSLSFGDFPPKGSQPGPRHLDFTTMRVAAQARYGCTDLLQVRPVAERFRESRGDLAFAEASYRWLLRRIPDEPEPRGLLSVLPPGWTVMEAWERFVTSEEFHAGPGLPLLGPWQAGFPFRRVPG